jgi:hypothetical protein
MALGFNKLRQDERFLAQDDEPEVSATDLGRFLKLIDLLSTPAKSKQLAQQAVDALKTIDDARKATADLEVAKKKADDKVTAAGVEIDRLKAAHDKWAASVRKEVEAEHVAAKEARKAADADRAAAADLKAEQLRRLHAMEGA